ncbi:hypothetical protein MM440_12310 [Arsenicicoccus piscis]|uniref:Ig-like domain-containing protein n=1 Tax=Arsenicicoccus piscis TaxID=673954 RepID=A0ABQ6HP70_9MICO|nr:hypothetical protein [Arsenicicoccus piscis]MCH8628528.1 hypothetical protein [Arsenicicoccus piscis]GMA19893.1 hypothetical protein GCM10025862_19140 [Arsenicicoccus piscis]
MTTDQWDLILQGISLAAAIAAAGFAFWSSRTSHKQLGQVRADAEKRDRQSREAQARRIFWDWQPIEWTNSMTGVAVGEVSDVFVCNESDEPVVSVVAVVWDSTTTQFRFERVGILRPGNRQGVMRARYEGAAMPKIPPGPPNEFSYDARGYLECAAVFRDAVGTWWIRYPDMTLSEWSGPQDSYTSIEDAVSALLTPWLTDHTSTSVTAPYHSQLRAFLDFIAGDDPKGKTDLGEN